MVTVDAMTTALDLAALGVYTFPVDAKSKRPLTPHGHTDAEIDVEAVATMFSEYPGARVGVNVGKSGLVALDIDLREDGRNGFNSLDDGWLEVPHTWTYDTPSGGQHMLYAGPSDLKPQAEFKGLKGIDRKSGSSYVIYYGQTVPESRDAFKPAPEWLLLRGTETGVGSSFEGNLDQWLNTIAEGEPDGRVQKAMLELPTVPFDHQALISAQYNLVRIAAEGGIGVRPALEMLRNRWLTGEWDTPDEAYEFDAGLYGAVKKAGAEDAQIAALPKYADLVETLPADLLPLMMGTTGVRADYFRLIKTLISSVYSDQQIAALVWGSPKVKVYAREWGISYLVEQIEKARHEVEMERSVINPVPQVTELDQTRNKSDTFTLLSDTEREEISFYDTYLDRYLHWAGTRVNVINAPYHQMNALTVLSSGFGGWAFIDVEVETWPLNLFTIAVGPSSSGKSQSISLRRKVLSEVFKGDPGYNLGADASIQGLHKALLSRDGKVSIFNSDEAHGVFLQLTEQKWSAGLVQRITDWYGGYVPPMIRVSDSKAEGADAHAVFIMTMFGIPDDLANVLTEAMFKSGFLARVLWFIGDPSVDDPNRHLERRGQGKRSVKNDVVPALFAQESAFLKSTIGHRGRLAVGASPAALKRMTKNRAVMEKRFTDHPRWSILEPSLRRLGDNIAKVAALLALADGCEDVELHHALAAIELGEMWLENLVTMSEKISSSVFQRECDEIEAWLLSRREKNATEAALYHRFRNMGEGDPRQFNQRLESLRLQGRVQRIETNSVVWQVNV